ncbi:Oxidoreductase, short chain dehydrogenase/reductase family protein [Enhygromyxa salina]|uniref:Oxidoreductase, short chain dehydrogenase/reductase family protein n=1 Tax=Enhygromyxa salina TaxID=215803 RepID=A0A0C1ZC86_9BACT|nr:SDR family oxidoreductase [Enhygromyxa salina]KIG15299.1 Oxidoreductase, short chain dehydrogenase/reductase family protein [Enhygromyxa salina]
MANTTQQATRWALILGATSGAGAAISKALARQPGLNVLGLHRGNHPEGVAEVTAAVQAAGREIEWMIADAGKPDRIAEQADAVLERVGKQGVHIMVHSIANASVGLLASGDEAAWIHPKQVAKTFDSMAHSFVYWTQALLRRELLGPGARLLALDNAINESLLGNLSVIAASKAALETYVRHLALELGPLGYRVNALKFGTVESAALQWVFPAEVWDRVKAVHDRMFPARRMNTMDEVAALVSVLADDAGYWFNSAVIDFTGGQMHAVYQTLMDVVINGTEMLDGPRES